MHANVAKFSFLVSASLAMLPSASAGSSPAPECDVMVAFNPVKTGLNTYDLGTMEQRCDAEKGYRVFADGGEPLIGAIMQVSGRPVSFDEKGTAMLVATSGPDERADTLILITQGAKPNTLSFRIEANI